MKIVGGFVLAVIIILGMSWLAEGNDFFLYKYFAPREERVHRQIFEQTPSYNKGMVQELENMEFEYEHEKDQAAKSALRGIILHRASGYNLDDPDVPNPLREFIAQLKESQ